MKSQKDLFNDRPEEGLEESQILIEVEDHRGIVASCYVSSLSETFEQVQRYQLSHPYAYLHVYAKVTMVYPVKQPFTKARVPRKAATKKKVAKSPKKGT